MATKISPFEVVHGFSMPLPNPIEGDQMVFPTADANAYYCWLRNALKLLHSAVHQNRVEAKQDMKAAYDRRHAVRAPTFRIGDVVLLLDRRVKPNSDRVLTHKLIKMSTSYQTLFAEMIRLAHRTGSYANVTDSR